MHFLFIWSRYYSFRIVFLCRCLYSRKHSRNIMDFNNLSTYMPVFSVFLFILILSNLSMPLTINFPSEMFTLYSIFDSNIFIFAISTLNIFISSVYSLWLFNRLVYTSSSTFFSYDLNRFECNILLLIILLNIIFGIYPNIFYYIF